MLRDTAGRPRLGEWLHVWRYGLVRSDAAGRVVLDPAPPGALHVALPAAPGSDVRWQVARQEQQRDIEVRL